MVIKEETELNYSVDDIIDSINDELGFSAVMTSKTEGYFILGGKAILAVDFSNDIKVVLTIDDKDLDLSDSSSSVEMLVSTCESAIEIRNIIARMTSGGGVTLEDEDNN